MSFLVFWGVPKPCWDPNYLQWWSLYLVLLQQRHGDLIQAWPTVDGNQKSGEITCWGKGSSSHLLQGFSTIQTVVVWEFPNHQQYHQNGKRHYLWCFKSTYCPPQTTNMTTCMPNGTWPHNWNLLFFSAAKMRTFFRGAKRLGCTNCKKHLKWWKWCEHRGGPCWISIIFGIQRFSFPHKPPNQAFNMYHSVPCHLWD